MGGQLFLLALCIHLPLIFLIIAVFQNIGLPTHKIIPSPLAFAEFGMCVGIALVFAYVFSLFTERQTDFVRSRLRAAMSESNQAQSEHIAKASTRTVAFNLTD